MAKNDLDRNSSQVVGFPRGTPGCFPALPQPAWVNTAGHCRPCVSTENRLLAFPGQGLSFMLKETSSSLPGMMINAISAVSLGSSVI